MRTKKKTSSQPSQASLPDVEDESLRQWIAARNALWRGIFCAIPPRPALTVSGWAAKHRFLSEGASSEPGKFSLDRIPYQVEPMDAPLDEGVAETVLWWASQTGKSELCNNIVGYFMHADPATILFVQPTIDLTEAYSTERIAPMIRDTPILRQLVKDPRSRDSGNTLKSKRYPGGNLAMVGANAPSGLAGRPRRVILLDEVDRYPASAGTEGDPCALADKRAETFPNAIKIKTSTGTVKGASKIESLFEQSDKRKWHVCCPKCRHEWVLMWENVRWPEGKPEDAWLECPVKKCAAKLTDGERMDMVRAGRWIATAPFKGIRGYWLNGINTLFRQHKGFKNRLHEMVSDFLKAKDGGAGTMRVWINTFLAETYEEEAEALDTAEMENRAEEYTPTTIPEDVVLLTCAADVHRIRIEYEVKGWGKDEESWGIRKGELHGDTEKDEVWGALDAVIGGEFIREDSVILKVARTFVDMGYRSPQVLKFCAARLGRGVFPCRGINRVGLSIPPILPAKPSRNNKARIPHWNVGVTVAKTAFFDRISLPIPGPRTMHFPGGSGYDKGYFTQFASEKRKKKFSSGQMYFIFEKINHAARNEALDLNVYNLAALHSMMPVLWDKLADNLRKSAPRAQVQAASQEATPPSVPSPQKPAEPATAEMRPDGSIKPAESSQAAPKAPPVVPPAAPTALQPRPPRIMRPRRSGGFVQGWR